MEQSKEKAKRDQQREWRIAEVAARQAAAVKMKGREDYSGDDACAGGDTVNADCDDVMMGDRVFCGSCISHMYICLMREL